MVAITINHPQFRHDSTVKPRVNISDYTGTPYIKLHNWQYFKAGYNTFIIEPDNRSMPVCPIYLRNTFHNLANWTIDPVVTGFSIVSTAPNGFARNGGTATGSWQGAYYNIALAGNIVSIQARATSTVLASGISLQNSPFTTHIYQNAAVKHSLIFGGNGKMTIYESGVQPVNMTTDFRYEVGDVALIECDSVKKIIRYYLVRGKKMILLRTTRSQLASSPIAEMLLFQPNSSLLDIFICDGSEAIATFENIGVARKVKDHTNFQKWRNQRTLISTADPIQLADGEFEFTFPTSKKTLRQIAVTPRAYSKAGFQTLEDFYTWHGGEKEFIFVDEARLDSLGNAQEFWARFASGMTDETGNGCFYDYTTQVLEAYRGDYVPRQLDVTPPVVYTAPNSGPAGLAHYDVYTTDAVGCKYARIFVDGVQIGADVQANGTEVFVFEFSTDFLAPGNHAVVSKAYDFAGNEGIAPTRNLLI